MHHRGFTQHHFFSPIVASLKFRFESKSGAGFTLVELLISIAITGFLAALMFNNFSKEKDRNALKTTVHQLQTEIQKMQTNAQGGVVTGSGVPKGYGVYIPQAGSSGSSIVVFADQAGTDFRHNSGDTDIRTYTLPTGVTINKLSNGSAASYTTLDIVFATPNGTAKVTGNIAPSNADTPNVASIYIKSSKLNVCYAITVTKDVGTVSQRQLTSSC